MRILWGNIIALILFIIAVVLLVKCWPEITATLSSLNRIGPGHSPDDKTTGLITLGLIGVVLVAIVKILTHGNPK